MGIYKISYIVMEQEHPGVILNANERPQEGDWVKIGADFFEVYDVIDVSPPQGEFHHVQAKCRTIKSTTGNKG